nr:unnamed protein product [Callosobruchus analis]
MPHHGCFACFNISKRKVIFCFTPIRDISVVYIGRKPPRWTCFFHCSSKPEA